jgi:hypothetical protein
MSSLIIDRPPGWEYLYFAELMAGELELSRRLELASAAGTTSEPIKIDGADFLPWIVAELASVTNILNTMTGMANDVLPIALGPNDSPGDPTEISYVTSRLGDAYRAALQWPLTCSSVETDPRWAGVLQEARPLTSNIVRDFRSFAARIVDEMPDTVARALSGQPVGVGFQLKLTVPDMEPLQREIDKLRSAFDIT